MTRKMVTMAVAGALLGLVSGARAAEEDEKRIVNGPTRTTFGAFNLVLSQGASAEISFQPDASTLVLKTLVGEARVVTSAQNLIMVENNQGRVEILLPNGRLIVVEPGRAEIVGRTLADDPGSILIRLSGTGPIAQAGAPPGLITTQASLFLLSSGQPSLLGNSDLEGTISGRGPTPLSPSQ